MVSLCFTAGPNTFDSPSDVAAAMAGSLAGVMDVLSPDSKKKGEYNLYLCLKHIDILTVLQHKQHKT